jgi:hypothetical protein
MKKLAMMVLVALFVSASSASAWWIFGKKAAEPAKDDAVKIEQPADKADCGSMKAEKKATCEAKKAKCCKSMSEEDKAKCKAKCASMSEEDKAKCASKCTSKKAKKAKKAEKAAEVAPAEVAPAVEAPAAE